MKDEIRNTSRVAPMVLALSLLTASGLTRTAGAQNLPQTGPSPQTTPATGQPPQSAPPTIPTAPPPTGLQAPLPAPTGPQPKPDRPLLASPRLNQLTGRVPPQPLSIDDAVAIALANNRQLALSTAALLRAQGRLSETRAGFNPTANSSFTYTRLGQAQSGAIGGGGTGTTTTTTGGTTGTGTTGTGTTGTGTGTTTGATTGTTGGTTSGGTTGTGTTGTGGQTTAGGNTSGSTTGTSTTAGSNVVTFVNADQPVLNASVALPIDIAGLLRDAVRQAQFLEVAQRIDINRTRNQIVLDTKSAFYNVLRQSALLTVAQETLRNAQDRLRDAQLKFAAGTVAQFDVIRAQTDVDNARQQVIAGQANVDSALGFLNNNMGLNIDTPLSITSANAVADPPGVTPPTANITPNGAALPTNPVAPPEIPTNPTLPPLPEGIGTARQPVIVSASTALGPEYQAVVQEAFVNRPEILEADAQIAAARKGIRLARRSQLPTLNLSASIQYSPNVAGFSPQTETEAFVIALSFPLYDGGIGNTRVTQARADVATAEINRRIAVDTVNLDVRSAYINLLEARDRVAVANSALGQALESYRLARVRYTNGVSTLVEVSDAQNALTLAENNQVNALYDYNNARATLDKAAGRYAYISSGPGFAAPPPPKMTGSAPTGGRK